MKLATYFGIFFLWGLLAVAVVTAQMLCWKFPSKKELKQVLLRVKTWFYIIAVFTSFFFLPAYWTSFVLCLLGIGALWEIGKAFSSIPQKSIFQTILSIGLSGLVIVSLFSAYFIYTHGRSVFFWLVVLTQLNDIFQYLWGKSLGKHSIAPKISPTKTWAGFLGGVVTCALLSYWTAPYYTQAHGYQAVIAGGIIACLGFWGDITVSLFKRQCSLKDLGTCLPGHGGLLDRIDSLLYILPMALWCLRWF